MIHFFTHINNFFSQFFFIHFAIYSCNYLQQFYEYVENVINISINFFLHKYNNVIIDLHLHLFVSWAIVLCKIIVTLTLKIPQKVFDICQQVQLFCYIFPHLSWFNEILVIFHFTCTFFLYIFYFWWLSLDRQKSHIFFLENAQEITNIPF